MQSVEPAVDGFERGARRPILSTLWALADYAFAFFVLFIASDAFVFLGLHSLAWLAAYAYFFLRLALAFQTFAAFLGRNLAYLVYPALCLVSILWSDVPLTTAAFSLQLAVTALMAVFIGMRLSLAEILWLLSFGS